MPPPNARISDEISRMRAGGPRLSGAGGGLGGHQQLDALVQRLDDLGLLDEETRARRDVDGAVGADGRVLTARAAHRQAERARDLLGLGVGAVAREVGDLNVHRGAHARAEVGGARGDVAVLLVLGKLANLEGLDEVEHRLELAEDLVDEGALLHDHDAQVVLLSDPDDLLLVVAHPAATAVRPVGGDAGRLEVQVGVHVLEHDVLLDELLVLGIVDKVGVGAIRAEVGRDRVDLAPVAFRRDELIEGGEHGLLELDALFLAHRAGQVEGGEVAADAHAHRDGLGHAELGEVEHAPLAHARGVPIIDVLEGARGVFLVVVADDLAEEGLELGQV
eukprot:scaffold10820_cov54-Phaeocystis_antarctica.AAC.2